MANIYRRISLCAAAAGVLVAGRAEAQVSDVSETFQLIAVGGGSQYTESTSAMGLPFAGNGSGSGLNTLLDVVASSSANCSANQTGSGFEASLNGTGYIGIDTTGYGKQSKCSFQVNFSVSQPMNYSLLASESVTLHSPPGLAPIGSYYVTIRSETGVPVGVANEISGNSSGELAPGNYQLIEYWNFDFHRDDIHYGAANMTFSALLSDASSNQETPEPSARGIAAAALVSIFNLKRIRRKQ